MSESASDGEDAGEEAEEDELREEEARGSGRQKSQRQQQLSLGWLRGEEVTAASAVLPLAAHTWSGKFHLLLPGPDSAAPLSPIHTRQLSPRPRQGTVPQV